MQVQAFKPIKRTDSPNTPHLILAALIVGLIVSIPIILSRGPLLPPPRDVQIITIIDRYAETDTDWTAIRIAESTNFSLLFGIPPFETTDGHTYTPNIQWETWFHYVNNHTLDHYLDRARFGTKYHYNLHITLNYTAHGFFASNLSVEVVGSTVQVATGANLVNFRLSEYVHYDDSRWIQWTNGSYYTQATGSGIPHEMSANYGSGYFLYMSLEHEEWWSPVAAFGPRVDQFVIMDTTYHILFATAIEEGHWIA